MHLATYLDIGISRQSFKDKGTVQYKQMQKVFTAFDIGDFRGKHVPYTDNEIHVYNEGNDEETRFFVPC